MFNRILKINGHHHRNEHVNTQCCFLISTNGFYVGFVTQFQKIKIKQIIKRV